jgi:hypothetical protein
MEAQMKKIPLILIVVLILGVLATQAFTVPLSVRNGIVVGYTAGKDISIRIFDGTVATYTITSKTAMLPSSAQFNAGDRVTIFSQRMVTSQTDGNIVIFMLDRVPNAGSSSNAATGTTAPAATPTP